MNRKRGLKYTKGDWYYRNNQTTQNGDIVGNYVEIFAHNSKNVLDIIAKCDFRYTEEPYLMIEDEIVEPKSDSPKTVTTKTTEVVEFSSDEVIEELKSENEKLRKQLAESPADAPVNTNKFSADRPVLTTQQYNKLSKKERFLYNLNK